MHSQNCRKESMRVTNWYFTSEHMKFQIVKWRLEFLRNVWSFMISVLYVLLFSLSAYALQTVLSRDTSNLHLLKRLRSGQISNNFRIIWNILKLQVRATPWLSLVQIWNKTSHNFHVPQMTFMNKYGVRTSERCKTEFQLPFVEIKEAQNKCILSPN